MSVYNKKDIIRINQEIGESGNLRNDSSLDFALNIIKQNKSWLFQLSHLLRCLLVDHPFVDGNKRTALILVIIFFENNNYEFDKEKLVKTVHTIARKNIIDINKISRSLLKC